jgi:hypothetical protein
MYGIEVKIGGFVVTALLPLFIEERSSLEVVRLESTERVSVSVRGEKD